MIHPLIGLIVGLIIGITGAGGALIAIPLFQLLLNASLKEATALSLVTVLLGTIANLITRLKEVRWRTAFTLALSGTMANYTTVVLKEKTPDVFIVVLLTIIGTISIVSVWRSPAKVIAREREITTAGILGLGIFLGLITTLTGLGGGVLLIPILIYIFGMTYEDALPTSLATIFFISLSALIIQREQVLSLISLTEIIFIGLGAFTALTTLKVLLKKLSADHVFMLRKYVFISATLASLFIVIAKAL